MNIAQVRAQYPQYQDLSDKQLADALHAKFYSDIPIQDYYGRIGLAPTTGAFAAGVKSYLPQVQETFGGLKTLLGVGAERVLGEGQISRGLIESGAASMKEAEAKRQPFMTAERGSFTDALDKGVGAVLTEWLPYQAGSGAMQLLESLGLMGAGALAGSALPGPGTIAGAGTGLVARELAKKGVKEAAEKILKERGEDAAKAYFENEAKKAARKIGGTAAIGAQAAFYGTGQTTSRAVEEAEKLGGTATDIELARVLPAAAVSTVAEFIGDKIALGALKGIKPGEPGKFVAADLAKNILLNIGLTGTKEVPVEVIQSAAERFGAKLSLTDAQALKEYIDATAASYGMAVAPGVGGGVRQTMAERAKPAPEVPPAAPPPVAPKVEPEVEPEKPMITRVMNMASQQNGYGLLEQQKQRLLAELQTEDIKKELTFIQEIQDRMNIETAQRLTPSGKSPFEITPEFLTELGIKPTAAVARRIKGKSLDDPAVATELETYANKYASEEAKPKILEFVQSLKPPVEPIAPPVPPAAEAPAAPVAEAAAAPVPPPVAPAPPPVAAVEPSVAEDSELVTAAPVVEAAAPAAPKFEPQIISRQPAPDGMEVHVFTTTDGYGTGLFDADANQYVNGSVTRFAGEDTLPKAEARAAEMLQKATPVEAAAPKAEAPAAPAESDKKALEEKRQMIADMIETKKANREAVPEAWVKKLADVTAQLRGETIEEDVTYSMEVPGHPLFDGPPVLRNLVPIKVKDSAAAQRALDRALDLEKEVATEFYSARQALSVAKTAAQKKAAQARVKKLNDQGWDEDALKTLRTETIGELSRLVDVTKAPEAKSLGGERAQVQAKEDQEPDNFLYSVEPTIKSDRLPSYKRGVEKWRRKLEKGEISPNEFAMWVDMIARRVDISKQEKEFKGRERGADFIRQRLLEAKRRGDLSEEAVDFAEWFIQRNPALVDDLGISIRKPKEDGVGGMYSEMARVMYLMKERGNDQTIVHEILHHLERMMPADVQTAIRKNWIRSLMEAQKTAETDVEKEFFANLIDYHFANGPRSKLNAAIEAIKDGKVDRLLYQYTSPSEFWAVNGSEIMQSRFDVKGALLQRLRRWLSELKEKARDLFGLNSTAPIIRALDSLSKGDGKFVSKTLLDDVRETRQVIEREGAGKEAGEAKSLRDRATANFRRWFGDSKVVDEKGEPLVVYHGSDEEFTVFDKKKMREGRYGKRFYFADTPERAKAYGKNVMPVYLRITNPGFGGDGLIAGSEVGNRIYMVFEPTQIKSAIGNNGDYSLTNADIRKSIGGIKAAAQKALQKQPMPEKGLGHVKQDLKNLAQSIFFAQNKTILDRIDGMKDRFWQRVAQNTADQFRTIKEYSPLGYMQARLSKSVDGGLEGLLFHGQVFDDGGALNIKAKTKGMMDILKPLGNELDSYLMWVALNRESNLPEEKRSKIPNMDQLVARRDEFSAGELNGKPRAEVYRDVLRQMNQLNKSVLDIALAKGLIDQKGYDKFSGDIYYVPFYKKMEEDGTIAGAQTASGLTSQDFSKELKGSDKPFGDLMENVVRNWSHILSASMKNAAAKTTLDDAVELGAAVPNLKTGLEWKDGKVYSIKSGKPIEAKVDEDGREYAEGELRPDLTKQDAGMAKIMVDGQPMYFKVTDDLLMDSISSIGYLGPKSKFILLMRDFKNMLQYGVTASPIFKVNNLIRDSVAAMAVSDLKKNPVANVLKGISLSDKDSPTYISALAGGAIFNFGSAYEGDQAKLIKRLLDQGVPGDSILDTKEKITKGLKTAWDAYQNLGDKSEAANRLSLYQQMRDKGMTHLQASFMARDLLDFSMQGSWPAFRFFTQVVPFMNARIQGLYKLGRDGIIPTTRVLYNATTGKEIDANDKIRAAQFATITTAVMLASALLYLSFKDDEDFKKRDAWDRDNFWWIKLPGMDVALRVPKPFEVGAFGTLAERTLEQILDQGAEGKQFGESLGRTLWDTFSLNPTPQMFKPLIDIYANKDSFSGAPIESAGLERLSKQERATDQTSPLAIALGGVTSLFPEKFQLSPVQMDYMLKGYFGWLGAMASVTSTYAVMPFKEGEYPDARWLDRASLGLARELPAPQSAYVTQFYNASKEISQAYADMRHYREMGDAEKVQEILEEKGDKIALAKFYDKTAKNIANIRKQIQLITNDKDMDGAEKKEAIERMKLIMSDLAKQAEEVRKSMKQ